MATVEGDVDLTTPQGPLIARILVSVARNEVEVKTARQKLANAQHASLGKPYTSILTYGYARGLKAIKEDEATVIREMAKRVIQGHRPPEIVREIEMLKSNENLWRIYGLGEIGVNEGQIIANWTIIPRVPKAARKVRYVLDFGFSNDPAALGALYQWKGGFVIHEMAHATGLDNLDLANIIRKYERLQPATGPRP